jgi:hypothetical protein
MLGPLLADVAAVQRQSELFRKLCELLDKLLEPVDGKKKDKR